MTGDVASSPLPVERSIYVANVLLGILYGLLVYMVFQSYYFLTWLSNETPGRRRFYIAFGFIQLFLVTVEFSLTALVGQWMWIDHRNSAGGPFAYYVSMSSGWFGITVTLCAVLSTAMTDGLLLYRCYIIWNCDYRVILIPFLLYLAELAMGLAVPVKAALSHTTILSKPSTSFSILWISLECSLTVLLTALIVGRILYVAREIDLDSNYTGVVSLLIEPALPLSLSGIAFAVCVARNSLGTIPLAEIWIMLVAIAPQSIILRVATGRAWPACFETQVTKPLAFVNLNTVTLGSHVGYDDHVIRMEPESGAQSIA